MNCQDARVGACPSACSCNSAASIIACERFNVGATPQAIIPQGCATIEPIRVHFQSYSARVMRDASSVQGTWRYVLRITHQSSALECPGEECVLSCQFVMDPPTLSPTDNRQVELTFWARELQDAPALDARA